VLVDAKDALRRSSATEIRAQIKGATTPGQSRLDAVEPPE